MNYSAVPDMEINLNVRKLFVRNQIDLGWLSHHACRGTVYIHGKLQLLPGLPHPLTPAMVETLFNEIGDTFGVCGLVIELQNWQHNGINGDWRPAQDVDAQSPDAGLRSARDALRRS